MKKLQWTGLLILCCVLSMSAQNQHELLQKFLEQHHQQQGLTKDDIANWEVTSQHISNTSGATHLYFHQTYQGIPIINGVANVAIKDGAIKSMGNRLVSNLKARIQNTAPSLSPQQAIEKAAQALQLDAPQNLRALEPISPQHFVYNKGNISKENIPVQLVYYATQEGKIKLTWDLSIYTLDAQHWWSAKIDAQTGELVQVVDWVVHCNFEHGEGPTTSHTHIQQNTHHATPSPETVQQPDQYTVYALPLESPSHGNRTIVTNPADILASPYGWHDDNGITGAEYTITRGNNVYAYEDTSDIDGPGFSPNGNAVLEFNFPFIVNNNPGAYQSAAITNLFYLNNMMHDIWYHHGFDEASGNFQTNNYNRGGLGFDEVQAEAQDGSGTNNANFATPGDGNQPRMQMYIWNNNVAGNYLVVNSPSGVAGNYNAIGASFGTPLPSIPITADLVLAIDGTAPLNNACEPIINTAALTGNIAVIDRGTCFFTQKVLEAQNAGAIAAIIVNNSGTSIRSLTGFDPNITIPSVMISLPDGNILKAQLQNGPINASLSNAGTSNGIVTTDSDFDNGVIAHEYGHGISNRLTGGGSNSNCLFNAEQMGEGWSDWFGLMITMEPGDAGTDGRGIGTYSSNQAITATGIRPAAYSTDFAINNYTYAASNNATQISQPHGIGFIFATMLWDLNWALINQYGGTPDPNLYTGTGGNNIAMKLVIEGIKLQPCNPGMVDGRNAILQADQLLYNGAHQCLIWDVFARRGLGYSANQGSPYSRSDQTEAFDVPPSCQIITQAPIAGFVVDSNSTCNLFSFIDTSANFPQSWLWRFGDGDTSTLQNPTHFYHTTGIYTVQLIVTNSLGQDSTTQTITVTLPNAPQLSDLEVCAGSTVAIPVGNISGMARWRNAMDSIIHIGDTLSIANITTTQTYSVENTEVDSIKKVGSLAYTAASGAITGGYNGLSFSAERSVEVVSAVVNANSAGPRTFILSRNSGRSTAFGNLPAAADIIEQVTINLVVGVQRVNLNFTIPNAGYYNIGVDGNGLFYDLGFNPPTFPYTLPGYLTLTSSIYPSFPTEYYYLYDLEVRKPTCVSAKDSFTITPIASNFTFSNTSGTFTFTDASVGATSWLWTFGDGDSSTVQNPVHAYTNVGTYTISLTINNGLCSSTQTVTITVIAINDRQKTQLSMALLPNPSSTKTTLLLGQALEEVVQVQILDVTGKVCQQHSLPQGQTSLDLNVSKLPAAVYFVQLKGSTFKATQKLVVE